LASSCSVAGTNSCAASSSASSADDDPSDCALDDEDMAVAVALCHGQKRACAGQIFLELCFGFSSSKIRSRSLYKQKKKQFVCPWGLSALC
jgi:hypothetical protein